jgi:hypothetical protein
MADESLATFFIVTETGQRARIVSIEYQSGDENLNVDEIRALEEIVQQHLSPRATVKFLAVAEDVVTNRPIRRGR